MFSRGLHYRLLLTASLSLVVLILTGTAQAVPGIEVDISEPVDADAQPRPSSAGEVFNKGFEVGSDSSPADGVMDFFKPHGDHDFVTKGTDFQTTFGSGFQRLTILDPVDSPVELPGGARLEPMRPTGGDVGIHKTYSTGMGDVWKAEAWVRLENVNRINVRDFRARLTFHKFEENSNRPIECNDVEYLDVTAQLMKMELICEVESPTMFKIRVNIRAHADPRLEPDSNGDLVPTDKAAASGTVAVDRFRLTLENRGL